jgi:hypothetical protein
VVADSINAMSTALQFENLGDLRTRLVAMNTKLNLYAG